MSDDEWVARLRGRYAEGGLAALEADPVFDDAEDDGSAAPTMPTATAARCPACEARPPLERLPGEHALAEGLRHCPACFGFWASDSAVAMGLSSLATGHPAAHAVEAPRLCRACDGHLKPDGVCAKCGVSRPMLVCPSCERPLERFSDAGATLDRCPACRWTWFDVGEISRVYGLERPDGLAAAGALQGGRPDDAIAGGGGAWGMALGLLGGLLRRR